MQQTKRHHYVPKAYLKAFCDQNGKLRVYRKDDPTQPLHVVPDATQFRRYYYSQPTPDGGKDNNALEALFSAVESEWPETVARLHRRENCNDRLENIFNFMSLQRVRVPAARDATEDVLRHSVRATMETLKAQGKLPPPPKGFQDLLSQVQVTIDPHQSIHAMVTMLQGMATLWSMVGIAAVHNNTEVPFITSDNPVLWFDPSLPFSEQRPYTIDSSGRDVFLAFPVSPKLAIIGSQTYKEGYGAHGLLHGDVLDDQLVEMLNAQTSRFAYEAVIAQSPGHEAVIEEFAGVSPVHEAVTIPVARGFATIHRMAFAPRVAKPKWKDD
jgi:hypothetical protein